MRRTAAGIAVSLLAAVAIGGPLASVSSASPATLQCATAAPPPACALLDQVAAQLVPVAPLLGVPLADLTAPLQGLAARSDQPAGVPTAEVATASAALLDQLAVLPDAVEALVGQTQLAGVIATLEALVAEATAPVTGSPQAADSSPATPAKTAPSPSSPPAASRTTSLGGSASTGGSSSSSSSSSSSPSSDAVPDVPVGDPLLLAPLAMPDFGFSQAFEPVAEAVLTDATRADLAEQAAFEALPDQDSRVELAVIVVLSLLLLAGAGIAQLQQGRQHTIPD